MSQSRAGQQGQPPTVAVRVSGPLALFTRPESKAERFSYPVLTPTAARGILESIFWKPQMRYEVREIAVLAPIRYASITTSEVTDVQSARRARAWSADGIGGVSAEHQRTQRHSRLLRDVSYVIRATIDTQPGSRYGPQKFATQFERRVRRGQCYAQPYLGTRECVAEFAPASGDERPIDVTRPLGNMVLNLGHRDGKPAQPRFFAAQLERGVLRVPSVAEARAGGAPDPRGGDAWMQWCTRYADRLDLPPGFYSERAVRYWLDLDAAGNLISPTPADTADPSSRATRSGTRRLAPRVVRTSNIKPRPFADTAEYALGVGREDPNPRVARRAAERHEAFVDTVAAAYDYSGSAATAAVLTFLQHEPLARVTLDEAFDPTQVVAFRVDGVPVMDDPGVQALWADMNSGGPAMQCLACLEHRPVMQRMAERVRGVAGAAAGGIPLVSANSPAFESWGLEGSLNAPLCFDCARRATRALNELMPGIRLGRTHLLAWSDDPDAANPLDALERPEADIPPGRGDVYLLAVSANVGRLVVRDAARMDGAEVAAHTAAWRAHQGLNEPVGLRALVGATVRDLNDAAPWLVCGLARGFLTGDPLPLPGLVAALRQVTSRGGVNRGHAALIRLVLTSHQKEVPMALDPEHESVAYQCGRMLAALVLVERALHSGNTRAERRMPTAALAPRRAFPQLLQRGEADLRQLYGSRDRGAGQLRSRVTAIADRLPALLPEQLTLVEQGTFMLGYYHELGSRRSAPAGASADSAQPGGIS